jgi:hypothetical protein
VLADGQQRVMLRDRPVEVAEDPHRHGSGAGCGAPRRPGLMLPAQQGGAPGVTSA